jgi:hypothetical protein
MITWHGYFQSGAGFSVRHDRSLGRGTVAARPEEIVQSQDLRDFLRSAFTRLRRLRKGGIDLEMPIVSAIAGAQARVARQRFGEFFLALEALHSIELERRDETFLLDDKVFKRVRSRLKAPLGAARRAAGVRSRGIHGQMTQKLTELNRPALWDGMRSLMTRLRVDWEDLYPEPAPERPTFLKMRNTLFHSHARAEDETIHKEAIRVESVVHRILLRWLGWEDLWNAPPPDVRHYRQGAARPAQVERPDAQAEAALTADQPGGPYLARGATDPDRCPRPARRREASASQIVEARAFRAEALWDKGESVSALIKNP